ncbi:MAG: carotenoid oxygenase family protein [Myxococcota bacterium]
MLRKLPAVVRQPSGQVLKNLELTVLDGVLPPDLVGHYYFIGALLNPEDAQKQQSARNYPLNGDGMLYRCDFQSGKAWISSEVMRSADQLADQATQPGGTLQHQGLEPFVNVGMVRMSSSMGARNFLNTAVVPMRFPGDTSTRLLVTYDGGRPHEVDPVSLKIATPVGLQSEWRPEAIGQLPFPAVLTAAHPVCDFSTGELFTVNYGRGTLNILKNLPVVQKLMELPAEVHDWITWVLVELGILDGFGLPTATWLREAVKKILKQYWSESTKIAAGQELMPVNFTHLVRWDGSGSLQQWPLVDEVGAPIVIHQSLHQLAVTRDYVILADTAFKFDLDQVLASPVVYLPGLESLLHRLLAAPMDAFGRLYIIKRSELSLPSKPLTVRTVRMPMEVLHFVADYKNPQDRIVLHIQHNAAMDIAEWLRPSDVNVYTGDRPSARIERYFTTGAQDISRLGRYEIDAKTGVIQLAQTLAADPTFWNLALCTGMQTPAWDALPSHYTALWWMSSGVIPELSSYFIKELYQHYPHRQVPMTRLRKLEQEEIPAMIFRVDAHQLKLTHQLSFAADELPLSLQHVPRVQGGVIDPDPDHGYLVAVVARSASTELRVYQAADLKPVCRLVSSDSNVPLATGLTIHSAWLPQLAPRKASYNVAPAVDFASLAGRSRPLRALYELLSQP